MGTKFFAHFFPTLFLSQFCYFPPFPLPPSPSSPPPSLPPPPALLLTAKTPFLTKFFAHFFPTLFLSQFCYLPPSPLPPSLPLPSPPSPPHPDTVRVKNIRVQAFVYVKTNVVAHHKRMKYREKTERERRNWKASR